MTVAVKTGNVCVMTNLKSYRVDLGGAEIFVQATSKLDAERKAIRVALDTGADRDALLGLTDDQVKVTRA